MDGKLSKEAECRLFQCVVSHDACTRVLRKYGQPWPIDEIEEVRNLERAGLLKFVDCGRMPDSGYCRRSTITPEGLAAIGAKGVVGMSPDRFRKLREASP